MTRDELDILLLPEVRQAIEDNIDRDPLQIALDRRIVHAREVASQVKYLQRARTKLPRLYEARAIIPDRAFEQSSSEDCAVAKPLRGGRLLDLTCGLGIDSSAMAAHFEQVVALERDEVLADVVLENLRRMGIENVEVVTTSAEEFVASTDEHFDWVYADPDRRTAEGKRVVRLEDCSPNMVALWPALRRITDRVAIKNSPLFDVEEAFRLFAGCGVEVISLGGECKQVNIYIDHTAPTIRAEAGGVASFEIGQSEAYSAPFAAPTTDFERYKYLILPDVSLVHSRLVAAAFAGRADVWSNNGVALATERPQGVVGRVFEIERVCRFGDKELKKLLKGSRTELFLRDFAMGSAALYRKFSMREGADARWCFTRIDQALLAFKLI